ncbi:MAG: hypothetical protein CMO55_26210 [Verrucomicrobiales bacterium]|nr:hypothetical protein [Verrucomicrobiales bacterium]
MRPSFFSTLFALSLAIAGLVFANSASAGATCVAETTAGKVVELEITTLGTIGGFDKAVLTIKDKKGKITFTKTYSNDEVGQFAATVHDGKAVVIFYAIGPESDVRLSFIGTDQDEYDHEALMSILRSSERKKDKGNSLFISVYETGKEENLSFKDILVTLDKDV